MRISLIHQLFVLILIPVVCVVGFVYFQTYKLHYHFNTQLEDDLTATLTQVERELELISETTKQMADMIAHSEDVVKAHQNRQADFLFQWGHRLVASGLVDQVTFIDQNGVVLARGHDEYAFNDSLAGSSFFGHARQGKPFTGVAVYEGSLALISVQPVTEFGSIFHGAVIVTRRLAPDVKEKLEANLAISLSINLDSNTTVPAAENPGNGFLKISRRLGFETMESRPAIITIEKDYHAQQSRYATIKKGIILVTVLSTCLVLLLLYISVSVSLKPIRALHTWLVHYRRGELSAEELDRNFISLKGQKNELGAIAHSAFSTLQELEGTRRESSAPQSIPTT